MNFYKIYDKKEDYLKLSELNPNNLYFLLAQKTIKYINSTNNKNKINLSWNLLGNKIDFFYGDDQVNLVVNHKRFTGTGTNLKALEGALYDLFQGELKGEVVLNRPDNRSVLSDRNDFNKASGTCFSKLYKSVAWDKEGKKNSEVLQNRSNAFALTVQQYKNSLNVPSFKKTNFELVEREGVSFYKNKRVEFIDFNSAHFIGNTGEKEEVSVDMFQSILSNQEKYLGYWSRTYELYELFENIENNRNTVVLYKNRAWIVIRMQSDYKVVRFI